MEMSTAMTWFCCELRGCPAALVPQHKPRGAAAQAESRAGRRVVVPAEGLLPFRPTGRQHPAPLTLPCCTLLPRDPSAGLQTGYEH